ncbi:MAG: hypothetical protein U1F87_14230 [Kiritimatiellia bacterium]
MFSTPTASDNCDATPTLTFADATVPGSCPQNFVRTRTWTATDKCGNVKTASQATAAGTPPPRSSAGRPGCNNPVRPAHRL